MFSHGRTSPWDRRGSYSVLVVTEGFVESLDGEDEQGDGDDEQEFH